MKLALRHFAILAATSIAVGSFAQRNDPPGAESAKVHNIALGVSTPLNKANPGPNPLVLDTPGGRVLPPMAPASGQRTFGEFDHPQADNATFNIGSIFGTDNRVRKTNTEDYAWSTQCQIITTYTDNTTDQGSGTIIGSKYVITAYHVVSDTGKTVRSVQVVPGMDDGTRPFGTFWASEFMYWDSQAKNDMAVIKLTTTVSGSTGTLGLAAWSDNDGKTLNLAGYPGDKGGDQLWYDNDPCWDQTTNYLYYKVDTFDGQSGSGVYRMPDGARYVVAVHQGSTTHSGDSTNVGVRVTNSKFDDIIDYM